MNYGQEIVEKRRLFANALEVRDLAAGCSDAPQDRQLLRDGCKRWKKAMRMMKTRTAHVGRSNMFCAVARLAIAASVRKKS